MALFADCTLQSTENAPLSMSRHYIDPPKGKKESPADYDERTWRERLHYDAEENVFLNNMAFKWCISDSARLLGMKIPGKGVATYSKYFDSGILVLQGMMLGLKKNDVTPEKLFVPADGKHGSGKRVWRTFPLIPAWSGTVQFIILNRIITPEVFQEHLEEAGRFIGLGRFRPQRGGYYGRFSVKNIEFTEDRPVSDEV